MRRGKPAGATIQYFQGGHHHLQLADVLVIGQGRYAVRLSTGWRSAGSSGCFFRALLERGQLHKRVGRRPRKITPGQCQRFVNPGSGIPQGGQQHPAMQIRYVMEQGADFRRQQIFRQFVLDQSHLTQGQCSRIVNSHRQQCGWL